MSKWLTTSGTHKHIKLENGIRSMAPQAEQIANILEVQASMNRGQDLKVWSLSARRSLGAAGGAAFVIPKGDISSNGIRASLLTKKTEGTTDRRFEAPKLAMIVASPVIADYFVKNPESEQFHCRDVYFKTRAIEQIAFWLRISLTVPKLENIHLPKLKPELSVADLRESLDLRVAMQLLGMSQHIRHFVELYKATLEYPENSAIDPGKTPTVFRIPSTAEARIVLDHAIIGARDEVVDALAYHMVVVKKKQGLDLEWEHFLSDHRNFMLNHAMKLAETVFAAKIKEQRKSRDQIKKHQRQQSKNEMEKSKMSPTTISDMGKNAPETTKALPRDLSTNPFELLAEKEDSESNDFKGQTRGGAEDDDAEGWTLAKKR